MSRSGGALSLNLRIILDARDPDMRPADVAECKGIGHPDTLADSIADEFSRRYSSLGMESFGVVPNHWVDKVTLIGAAANVSVGSFEIVSPIRAHLIGKLTRQIGGIELPIQMLFAETCRDVFRSATKSDEMFRSTELSVFNTAGTASDHPHAFYEPSASDLLKAPLLSNDTSACHANSRLGLCGQVAVSVERFTRSLTESDARIGSDFKVMCVRFADQIRVIVAAPVHADRVSSMPEYREVVSSCAELIAAHASALVASLGRAEAVEVIINSKDQDGGAYVAPFGTSLGKGDCGAVGRGNRMLGAIEPMLPSSAEAPAGKNPVHHAGKVYTWLAAATADRISLETGCYAEVTIISKNGADLFVDPMCVISIDPGPYSGLNISSEIEGIWSDVLNSAASNTNLFIAGKLDPNQV